MNAQEIELKFRDKAQAICNELGYVLYDLNYVSGAKTLRVFIMNKETQTALIEDCINVDRAFSPFMDAESWIPEEIILEVSSPGIYRHVSTPEHFSWAKGQAAIIFLKKTLGELFPGDFKEKDGKLKKFTAIIEDSDGESVTFNFNKDFSLKINYTEIKKANLEPDAIKSAKS